MKLHLESLEERDCPSLFLDLSQIAMMGPLQFRDVVAQVAHVSHAPAAPVLGPVDVGPSSHGTWLNPTFHWHTSADANLYLVKVFANGKLIGSEVTAGTSFHIHLPVTETVTWQVQAIGYGISAPSLGMYRPPGPALA
jgi:hypothetical protein